MNHSNGIEFYEGEPKHNRCICRATGCEFQPNVGDKVNIGKTTYEVIRRSFTVDYAGEVGQRVWCIVALKETP